MNLNGTLLGQMIAFGLFIWFCWKFVWPPLLAAMEEYVINGKEISETNHGDTIQKSLDDFRK